MTREKDIQRRTFQFGLQIIRLYRDLNHTHGAAWVLRNQLLRSATSIGANMEEADAAHSKADFIAKCRIALKESRETRYWLTLFGDSEELPREQIESLIHESNELVAILTSIVKNSTTARPSHSEF